MNRDIGDALLMDTQQFRLLSWCVLVTVHTQGLEQQCICYRVSTGNENTL